MAKTQSSSNVFDVVGKADGKPVASPGDWISISEAQIVGRLNPAQAIADDKAAGKSFIRPLVAADGQVVGRAFIEPDRYSWRDGGGWVTVAGLRANQLRNVQGILIGEADTASRDVATPLADANTLARWATEQAELLAEHVLDEERQAKTAEIVLECGGDVGALKIVKWGADWLNADEFVTQLSAWDYLHISFEGEFSYDEDEDTIHPKEFRQDFRQAADVAYVLKVDGAILRGNSGTWPKTNARPSSANDSNVARLIRELIAQVWGDDVEPHTSNAVVGLVNAEEIRRDIDRYEAPASAEDLAF